MRKIFSIIIFGFFSAVYLISSNGYLMKKIAPFRYEMNSPLGSDKYRYGDLFGLSYLPEYKIVPEKKVIPHCDYERPGNVNLFMICDSYIWGFVKTDSIFCNVNKMEILRWARGEKIEEKLDSTFKNILIIEVSERYARQFLPDTTGVFSSLIVQKENENLNFKRASETLSDKILRYLYNKDINQNLEFNLFDYRFLTPFKEAKAELNYRLFGRTSKDVAVLPDKAYLFYGPTIDSTKNTSSFNSVSETEVSALITCINSEYKHFKMLGFDEVYLSIIPNPVSILDPDLGRYNNLVERIQNRKDLNVPVIDIFKLFKDAHYQIFYKSDSHWNYDGLQIWVNQVNEILKKYRSE